MTSEVSIIDSDEEGVTKLILSTLQRKPVSAPLRNTTQRKSSRENSETSNSVSVCLTNCRYDVVKRVAAKLGYKEVSENSNWNLYWTDWSINLERCKGTKRFQRVNHFPGILEICRKDLLAKNLARMQRLFPKDYSFFPRTWCLPADLGEVLSYSRLKKNACFIIKPETGCQGKGIFITRNLNEANIKPSDRMVCQMYISRPFLIDGYKFDLRVYSLITSCNPLRVYNYRDGLVRFATSRYDEPTDINVTNVYMHLTNYTVNKYSRTYNLDKDAGSKRRLTWLYKYLKSLNYDVDTLWSRIDDVIIKTIISALPVLKHNYKTCFSEHDLFPACCELLGTDILLDRKLNPIILEVNHSPSFHTDTALDYSLKQAMVEDFFRMLNLEKCDKRKIILEDKRRARERLVNGSASEVPSCMMGATRFNEHFRLESAQKGNFRLIYPFSHSKNNYEKFLDQNQVCLNCYT